MGPTTTWNRLLELILELDDVNEHDNNNVDDSEESAPQPNFINATEIDGKQFPKLSVLCLP